MKKLLVILMLFWGPAWIVADDAAHIKGEIIKQLIALLDPSTQVKKVYIDKSCGHIGFPTDMVGQIVTSSVNADVILACDLDHLPLSTTQAIKEKKKTLIFLSYRAYIRNKKIAAGAFFWQKGRPNILINAHYIQSRKIHIPKQYRSFVE